MKKEIDQTTELEALRAKVAELEAAKDSSDTYFKELQQLKKTQAQGLNSVIVKPYQSDKHISLWHVSGHNIGKRVGPIHHAAAEDTIMMFAEKGIKLSLTKPSEEQIEKYKQTAEYKALAVKESKRRELKNRSRKESEISKLTEAIAKSQGIDPKDVNRVKGEIV